MFWLWNELFGFPVDSCDYEALECNKTYIPVLNWDEDNEFVRSLTDPYDTEWWLDASNVAFTGNVQLWADTPVNRVNQALDALKAAVMAAADMTSNITSFSFTPSQETEWLLTWTIHYVNDLWQEYDREATVNIKDLIEWFEALALQNVTVNEIHLAPDGEAPDFVLQSEKWTAEWVAELDESWKVPMDQIHWWEAEGVATLDENGIIPWDQLPVEIPRLYFSIWYWVFENSDTCVINDERIHLNSYVNISNYDDIEWDLSEVVWDWWLTVTSNTTETWTFRYFVVTPDPAYSNVNVPTRSVQPSEDSDD